MKTEDVEVLEREICFQGFFRLDRFRLRHRRFAGGWTAPLHREVFLRGGAVAVLPYDPVLDRVVLIEQFRPGALAAGRPAWMIETVAGLIEPGESPEEVCHRETLEEAGLTLTALERIAEFMPSPGGSSEWVTLYGGRVDAGAAGGIHGNPHEGEDIRVLTLPADDAIALVGSGAIDNAFTIIALQWLALNRAVLRTRWTAVAAGG